MNSVEVLVMHGSPGSGKSALSGAIADLLCESGLANAVIDLDDLARQMGARIPPEVARAAGGSRLTEVPDGYVDFLWEHRPPSLRAA